MLPFALSVPSEKYDNWEDKISGINQKISRMFGQGCQKVIHGTFLSVLFHLTKMYHVFILQEGLLSVLRFCKAWIKF